jgi:hypothetical protein
MRRRILVLAATVVSLLALTSGSVMAVVVTLDQHQDDASWNALPVGPGVSLGQTFKAGLSGSLVKVSFDVSPSVIPDVARPAAVPSILVQITKTSGLFPTGDILAQETLTVSDGWNDVDFGTPPTVAAGTSYAIVITPQTAGYDVSWLGNCTDVYDRGQALIVDGAWKTVLKYAYDHDVMQTICAFDFAFKTYVAGQGSPPPTSTGRSGESRDSNSPMLLYAGLAAGAAFLSIVSIRRLAAYRR